MIKIVFFDIDGTLIEFRKTEMRPKVIEALNQLKAKGIKIFIATGRPSFVIPKFEGVEFDGYLSFNGQYCLGDNKVIYENPLKHGDVIKMIDNADKMNHPVQIAGSERMLANYSEPKLEEYFVVASQSVNVSDEFDQTLFVTTLLSNYYSFYPSIVTNY